MNSHSWLGYNITLKVAPISPGGKFDLNLPRKTQLLPWDFVIFFPNALNFNLYF